MEATTSKMDKVWKENPNPLLPPLYENELRDIYWAEKALALAIPAMIKSATSEELKIALESHLEDAERKVDQIFTLLGREPEEKKGEEMKVIVAEAKELLQNGNWCYEGVTQSAARRKRLNMAKIYSTEGVRRSVR